MKIGLSGPETETTPGTLPESSTFLMHSEIADKDFQVFISLPIGYHMMADAQFPVLYLPDAWWTFGMATDIARVIFADQLIPPILIVGIGYPGEFGEAAALRVRDLTFGEDAALEQLIAAELEAFGQHPSVTSGGGENYLRFLSEELVPRVEREYRVDPKMRLLHGHSLGGTFVVNTIFRQPRAFTHYIASAPALSVDGGLTSEKDYALGNSSLPVNLYAAIGSLDDPAFISSFDAFSDTLKGRNYSDLRWVAKQLEGETHRSLMPLVLRDGLRWALAPSSE